MTGQQLKNSILQWAIQGKLVPQIESEGTAEDLLKEIRAEKEKMVKAGKLKKKDLEVNPIEDDEIPFEIPENWRWVRIKDICTKIVDGDHNPPAGISSKSEYLMLSSKNINYDKLVDLDSVRYLDKNVFEIENQRTQLTVGDILFTSVGTLGRSCVFQDESLNLCFQRSVSILSTLIYNQYLKRSLDSPYVQSFVVENATGTAQKGFYLNQLEKLCIPIPPPSEQHRIVAKIEELMPLVEEYGKAQEQLEALNKELPDKLKKSVLQEAIMGKLVPQDPNEGTADELLAEIRKEKENLVKAGKLKKKDLEVKPIEDDEVPFEIPEGWRFLKLEDICYLFDGDKTNDSGILLDAKYLRGKSTAVIIQGGRSVKKEDNIILVDGENSGEVFEVPIDGIMGSTFKQIIINKSVYKPYILIHILAYKEYLRNSKKGAAIPHLNKEIFRNLPIGLPPLAEQKRIVAKLEEVFGELERVVEMMG